MTQQIEKETMVLEAMKKWSGFNSFNVIFDSDLHGNGDNTLVPGIFNKSNLYFITYDDKRNVFGGFIKEDISEFQEDYFDDNAFVFSFIRNGKMKNVKYDIFRGFFGAFEVNTSVEGSDCSQCNFNYNGELNALVETHQPTTYVVERIIVVQMS
ncbi:TLDc domain-containing protein [Entamoeba marina]